MKSLILFLLVTTLLSETYSDGTKKPGRKYTKGFIWDPAYLERLRNSGFLREMKHPDQEVPVRFDARERWPECDSIGEIKNQRDCGSCWAVVLTSTLDDRLCISSNGTKKVRTSSEDLLTCCSYCTSPEQGEEVCDRGANPLIPVDYIATKGIVTGGELDSGIGCKSVTLETSKGFAPHCKHKCNNPNYTILYEEDRVFIKAARASLDSNVKQLQIEILKNGPLLASISMTDLDTILLSDPDFKSVYTFAEDAEADHVVRIIGWGTEKGVPYWLIANSYGESWGGNGGFFKLKRGVNLLNIELFHIGLITEFAEDPGIDEEEDGNSSGELVGQLEVVCAGFWIVVLLVNEVW